VHPAKLAWGLAAAAERLGVELHEHSPAVRLRTTHDGVTIATRHGTVRAARAALATNAFPALLPALRLFTVPIYDYVLMTEPLSPEQLAAIGWTGRHGITDSGREFHYARKTADDRILFGGYDAIYHRGRAIREDQDQRPETFERLADHFFSTFPQLAGIRFTHRWGGAIDMSTQLVAFHGTARGGRVAYSAGYTGLGVAATRFGAEVMLDLLAGADTERTRLTMSRRLPVPIPPEPIAYPLIQLMRRAVAKSDRTGRDTPLLKLAGLLGVGFDS
jgi:glycine/D-amino acid oxidase-like deaminating enzyme